MIGYRQCFDLEGSFGVVVRAIGSSTFRSLFFFKFIVSGIFDEKTGIRMSFSQYILRTYQLWLGTRRYCIRYL